MEYNPPLSGWPGGKSKLVDKILPLFPPHVCYVEAFAGAAWLFFKKKPSRVEVINDFDGEIANFYRVLRDNRDELIDKLKYTIRSRELFNEARKWNAESLDPIMRAWRFFYLLKTCFSGQHLRPCFGYVRGFIKPNKMSSIKFLDAAHARLKDVYIENLDYKDILSRYDAPTTFFYLDPPYFIKEKVYRNNFVENDFIELNENLKKIKGKFLLSLNDIPATREIFGEWEIMPVATMYTMRAGSINNHNKDASELLIANYNLADGKQPSLL